MSTALALRESERLAELEVTITQGLTTFVEVGAALVEIRDSRLYRETHKNFTDYCRERWGMGLSTANQLVDAAKVIGNLSAIAETPLPSNEAQTRPLTSLPPEKQREVWKEAVETAPNGKITASHVASVAQKAKDEGRHPVTAVREAIAPHAESVVRAARRPIDSRIRELISAALAMRDVDDSDIAALEADSNDLMLEGLRRAVEQITRIISINSDEGARRANA